MTRENPENRQHETYEKEHWETAHIERVDKVFATASRGNKDLEPQVRIDMDGFGSGGASLHGHGINLNTSHFMSPEIAMKLRHELSKALVGVNSLSGAHGFETRELDHVVLPNGVSVSRGTQFLVREPFSYDSARDEHIVFKAGLTFTVSELGFEGSDIVLTLKGAPLEFLEYEALLGHLDRNEIVIAETR